MMQVMCGGDDYDGADAGDNVPSTYLCIIKVEIK